ncbi:MAG: hypothetical protein ACX94C_11770 [Phycisphaerales bacterium]
MREQSPFIQAYGYVSRVDGGPVDEARNITYRVQASSPEIDFDQSGIEPYNRVHPRCEVHAAEVQDMVLILVNRANHSDYKVVFYTERETLRDCDGNLIEE